MNQLIGNRPKFLGRIVFLALLAIVNGLASFAFIFLVNRVIGYLITSGLPPENNFLLSFAFVILLFFVTKRVLSEGIIELSQEVFWGARRDIIELVLTAPYRSLLSFKSEVYSALTNDINSITNASVLIVNVFSSLILIFTTLAYMAYLSGKLFLLSSLTIAAGVLIYIATGRIRNGQFRIARSLEAKFIKHFNSLLDGAKEIKVNPEKGSDLYQRNLASVLESGKQYNSKALLGYLNSQLIGQLFFYGLIGTILLYAGSWLGTSLEDTISFTFVLLYLLTPIVSLMVAIPVFNRAAVALKHLAKLKNGLQEISAPTQTSGEVNSDLSNFSKVKFKDYTFSYGTDMFSVGPLTLDIARNELIFIFGGNGAGKTTVVNTLLNLYQVQSGHLEVDDHQISLAEVDEVKALFAPVFSDFYLFEEFYGMKDLDESKLGRYLELFELQDKVSLEDGRFSTIDLSMGQRKRLALISAVMEDKPILVLDEWAADQDPYFRKKFYQQILPQIIEQEDKTIIAITHDDRYYHLADKLVKMEYGKLEVVSAINPYPPQDKTV
ncbi:MAG: cyclic peptide export ABC transporter [Bacteroidota bacterium]